MDFTTLLNCRKSIRSFTGEAISAEARKNILHAANAAPAGLAKYETLHLTDIRNPDVLADLEKNAAKAFGVENRSFLYGAPELIVVSTTSTDNVGYSNAAIIAHNMAMAAVNEGAGVCHIWGCTAALSANKELIKALGIPDGFTPTCAIAVGKTNEVYAQRIIDEDRLALNTIE